MLAEAAYRAFIDAPEQAEALLRRGLRSPSFRSRIYTAGLLGAIDEPWSRHELWQAVEVLADPEETVYLRAALRCSQERGVEGAVQTWETRHGLRNIKPYEDFPREDCPVRKQVSDFQAKIENTTYPLRFRPIGKWGREGRSQQRRWRESLEERAALQSFQRNGTGQRELP
jgi:hypothetical protein